MKRALLACVLVACGTASTPAPSPVVVQPPIGKPLKVGDKTPPLSVQNATNLGAGPIVVADGNLNLVWFFATWSGPDKQALPKMEAIYQRFRGLSFRMVAVSVDDERQGVASFAKESGVTFDVGWDEGHRIANAWAPGAEPTFFLVDGNRNVRAIWEGYHDGQAELIAAEIKRLLGR
jgi:peroxiredoxin